MDVAVLGMGRMGRAIARRLAEADHDVVVWNRTSGRADEVLAAGAREAGSIAEAVEGRTLAITMLSNDDAVRDVILGEGGVAASLADGSTIVDASTVSPALAAELADALPRYVAMPVLGAPVAVASGAAVYLVGGDPDVASAVDPILPALSETVHRYPTAPLASAAKLTVNTLLLDGLVALSEAFTVGRAGGLTDDQLRSLLAEHPMVPPGLRNRFEGTLTGEQDSWWTTTLGAKDAGLAVDVAEGAGRDLPLTATARDRYRTAAEAGLDDADIARVADLYRG